MHNQVEPDEEFNNVIRKEINNNGAVVVSSGSEESHYLYTVGNNSCQLPEILLFCDIQKNPYNIRMLQNMCRFMLDTGAMPTPHKELVFQKKHYYPIVVDSVFIYLYCETAKNYYGSESSVSMIQLIESDRYGKFPHQPGYTKSLRPKYLKVN